MEPSVWFPQNIWKTFPYKKLNLFKKSSIATLPPDIKHSTHIKNVDKPKQQYWYNFNKSLRKPPPMQRAWDRTLRIIIYHHINTIV